MDKSWKEAVDIFTCTLTLRRHPVGIVLLPDEAAYEAAEARELTGAINYCQMVAAASHGNRLKAKESSFLCRSGARVRGLDPSDPKNSCGENWARLGLYESPELSRKIREELVYSEKPQTGVLLSPVSQLPVLFS